MHVLGLDSGGSSNEELFLLLQHSGGAVNGGRPRTLGVVAPMCALSSWTPASGWTTSSRTQSTLRS